MAGAVAAALLRLPARLAAALTAFRGGVLFAAIAFELVPEGDRQAGVALTAIGLLAGTLVYVAADAWLSRERGDGPDAPVRDSGTPSTNRPAAIDSPRAASPLCARPDDR